MFAVIQTGGKQYLVKEGDTLNIEKLDQESGNLSFDALLVSDASGASVKVGTPTVSGATVSAKIVEHGKGEKVSVIKFKRKVRYRRNVGHRQPFTKITIEKIAA